MQPKARNRGRIARWPLLVAAIPLVASCAGQWGGKGTAPPAERRTPSLEVYNNHPENVRIYLLAGGTTQMFLGSVESFTSRTFDIPLTASATPWRVLIQTFASRATYRTQELDFVSLPELEMRVGTNLKMTTIDVRR